jgi:hypothetical protein
MDAETLSSPRFPPAQMNAELKESDFNAFDDVLRCPLCSRHYTEPRIAPCQHVFCRECITDVLCNQNHCPECKMPLYLQNLGRIRVLETIVGRYKELIATTVPPMDVTSLVVSSNSVSSLTSLKLNSKCSSVRDEVNPLPSSNNFSGNIHSQPLWPALPPNEQQRPHAVDEVQPAHRKPQRRVWGNRSNTKRRKKMHCNKEDSVTGLDVLDTKCSNIGSSGQPPPSKPPILKEAVPPAGADSHQKRVHDAPGSVLSADVELSHSVPSTEKSSLFVRNAHFMIDRTAKISAKLNVLIRKLDPPKSTSIIPSMAAFEERLKALDYALTCNR